MSSRATDSVAVVTGASSGIGAATARWLANQAGASYPLLAAPPASLAVSNSPKGNPHAVDRRL
ncbi:hypothetical protein D0Z08_27785 [Nocardioides immobilis]|uniref:SDR family NAD(P)-dependent oxidoreductase n=1 Tax=Nocardioides immobilis TaxID=2049295 RepID=A0A417XTE9_9ACTN|nr:hypothetical protein D0Z08_27785 [Nocardioides immobilis]